MVTLDCVIVGAGPAGLTAAIYLQRFHRRCLLIDAGSSRAAKISRSHNCPGFPDGIAGPVLLKRLREQLDRFGGDSMNDQVLSASVRHDGLFELRLAWRRQPVLARVLLLCTGVEDRLPDLPGVRQVCDADRLRQCPICDCHEHSGQRIGVLGNTGHAEREAEFLRGYGADVAVVPLDASLGPAAAQELTLEGAGVRIALSDGSNVDFDVVYTALGVQPRATLAEQLGAELDGDGNIVVDAHCRTSVNSVYAAGDVVSGLDQIAVAFGHGAVAATAIHNALREAGVPPSTAAETATAGTADCS